MFCIRIISGWDVIWYLGPLLYCGFIKISFQTLPGKYSVLWISAFPAAPNRVPLYAGIRNTCELNEERKGLTEMISWYPHSSHFSVFLDFICLVHPPWSNDSSAFNLCVFRVPGMTLSQVQLSKFRPSVSIFCCFCGLMSRVTQEWPLLAWGLESFLEWEHCLNPHE